MQETESFVVRPAQVGQIMLNSPNALFKMGIGAGSITLVIFFIIGFWWEPCRSSRHTSNAS